MPGGPEWDEMDRQPRGQMAALLPAHIPDEPGVYALYRGDERMYVGKASSLRDRIWKNHSGRGAAMTGSAMRRNIAAHLGFAPAADIKARRYQPTPAELQEVRHWLDECDIAWRPCESPAAALELETAMKDEHTPVLTKR